MQDADDPGWSVRQCTREATKDDRFKNGMPSESCAHPNWVNELICKGEEGGSVLSEIVPQPCHCDEWCVIKCSCL